MSTGWVGVGERYANRSMGLTDGSLVTDALAQALRHPRPLLRRSAFLDTEDVGILHLMGWLYVLPWKSPKEIRADLGWPETEQTNE